MHCRHRETDYALTQFFTGHGSFGTYTKRIGYIVEMTYASIVAGSTLLNTRSLSVAGGRRTVVYCIPPVGKQNLGNVMSKVIKEPTKFNTFRAYLNFSCDNEGE